MIVLRGLTQTYGLWKKAALRLTLVLHSLSGRGERNHYSTTADRQLSPAEMFGDADDQDNTVVVQMQDEAKNKIWYYLITFCTIVLFSMSFVLGVIPCLGPRAGVFFGASQAR